MTNCNAHDPLIDDLDDYAIITDLYPCDNSPGLPDGLTELNALYTKER